MEIDSNYILREEYKDNFINSIDCQLQKWNLVIKSVDSKNNTQISCFIYNSFIFQSNLLPLHKH